LRSVGVTSAPLRRLAAILVADVVGFSKRMERDDAGTLARLRAMRADVVDPAIAANGGRIVKTTGDGLLVEFGSADAALRSAVRIQRALADRNASLPADERLDLRIGINLGDVIAEAGDIFGDGVNVAARLEALAPPGGICVSQAVRDQVHGGIDVEFVDAGEQKVKNIVRAIPCYSVNLAASPVSVASPPANQAVRPMSIGVLPFAAWPDDAAVQRRAKSITRDFTAMLARCGSLLSVKPVAAQRVTDVRYLAEGEVRATADGVAVDVQMNDAATGEQLWSEAVSLPRADDDKSHGKRLHGVAWRLSRAMVGAEVRRVTAHPEAPSMPLDFVVQALMLDRTEPDFAQRVRRKEDLFEEALSRDPNCVPALIGLAITLDMRLTHDLDSEWQSVVRRMDELTTRALRLNDTQPITWLLRSVVLMYGGQWQASLEAIERSIALEPYSSDLVVHRAWGKLLCGRPDESLGDLEESLAMDPQRTAPQMQAACEAQLLAGRYAESIAAGEKSLGLGPVDEFNTQVCLAAAYANAGDAAKAAAARRAILAAHPRYTITVHRTRVLSRNPDYLALLERHMYPGLRKAGLPEA
jgi:class 3 adenylate cyclase/tetratricopeptide (TPR) repeat protein